MKIVAAVIMKDHFRKIRIFSPLIIPEILNPDNTISERRKKRNP